MRQDLHVRRNDIITAIVAGTLFILMVGVAGSVGLLAPLGRLSLLHPPAIEAAGLSSASATLSNPRLSYQAGVGVNLSAGSSLVTISVAGTNANTNTTHLFPNDVIGIGTNGNIPVASIAAATVFTLQAGLTNAVTTAEFIYGTQSGTLAVNFYTAASIPVGGGIEIRIPASAGTISGGTNDGGPDTAATIANNGFDLNNITGSNITCPVGFAVGTVTAGAGGVGGEHKVHCNWSGGGALPAGANLTVVTGNAVKGLINPAAIIGHTLGIADHYAIYASTWSGTNGTGSLLEDVYAQAAPNEGVFVSATIDQTLTFQVAGVASIPTTCGFTPAGNLIDTSLDITKIPFGNNVNANVFYNAGQQLTITTNAPGGYVVRIEENDQMGKDGQTCNVPADHTADETGNCIKDTTCNGGACSESTSAEWTTATNSGLGFTLANVAGGGSDAAFTYSESSRTFSARQIADQQGVAPETKASIMNNNSPVNGNSVCIVYRLAVSGTQPAGYYFNKVKYTATTTF